MAPPATAMLVTSVGTVFVTVADQDAAIDLYVNKLGFELRRDVRYGDHMRRVEVAPQGAQTPVALNLPMHGSAPGGDLGYSYDTDDRDVAVVEMGARGVEIEEVMRMAAPVPPMVWFEDLDGNRMLLVQRNE